MQGKSKDKKVHYHISILILFNSPPHSLFCTQAIWDLVQLPDIHFDLSCLFAIFLCFEYYPLHLSPDPSLSKVTAYELHDHHFNKLTIPVIICSMFYPFLACCLQEAIECILFTAFHGMSSRYIAHKWKC